MPRPEITPSWIAVDWGTSTLRVWAMAGDGKPMAEASSDQGMAGLASNQFEPALLALIEGWLEADQVMPVIACGMVGARQGWVEAPYSPTPCAPLAAEHCIAVPAQDPRLAVRIIPGLMQADPPDVMRGEETQIAGFLADRPNFAGTLCLPGTHAKWVEIAGGEVCGFRTAMTGEVFALLAEQSVLRHSIGEGWDASAFDMAVAESYAAPEALSGRLFGIRAGSLLHGLDLTTARARLSGWLIGAEIAAMTGRNTGAVTVLGQDVLATRYAEALRIAGYEAQAVDAAGATLQGLRQAFRIIQGSET